MTSQSSATLPAPDKRTVRVFLAPLSAAGLVLGATLFCFSLTPSMSPRPPIVQGALGGIVFSLGYAIWYGLSLLLEWLEVRHPPAHVSRIAARAGLAVAGIAIAVCLWLSTGWQNSIRALWDLPYWGGWYQEIISQKPRPRLSCWLRGCHRLADPAERDHFRRTTARGVQREDIQLS